ncbi:hypothetical protein AC249_AIPGENE24412 [Exaiptasia diaphana]|nr:hypothetical protein AC249_AIPGENE24412 [Exaiptasia diaphana]
MADVRVESRDLSLLPDFSFTFVEQYRKKWEKSSGSKELSKGIKYYSEKFIRDVKLLPSSDRIGIQARCYHSQRKNETPHSIKITMSPSQPEVLEAVCSCSIGLAGACGHIIGVLFQLADYKMKEIKSIPIDIAKTSMPQTWHIPRGPKIKGTEVSNLSARGYSRLTPLQEAKPIKSTLYNPIKTELPPLAEFMKHAKTTAPTSLIHTVVDLEQQSMVKTKYGDYPKGSLLSYQQKLHSDYIINLYNVLDFPNLPVKNVMITNYNYTLRQQQWVTLHGIEVNKEMAIELEESTRLQSSDPKWHKLRVDRLTASKAGEIAKRQRSMMYNS